MKTSSFALALLVAATCPALAAAGNPDGTDPQQTTLKTIRAEPAPIRGHDALELLALETDLSARDVRLVLTTEAHDARYVFRSQRDMARQFADALGPARFADLVAGLPVRLQSPAALDAAREMTASTPAAPERDDMALVAVLARP